MLNLEFWPYLSLLFIYFSSTRNCVVNYFLVSYEKRYFYIISYIFVYDLYILDIAEAVRKCSVLI